LGGLEQAKAISLASFSPSKMRNSWHRARLAAQHRLEVVLHQLLARSVNHGWAGLQSFDDPVDAPPFAAFPDQRLAFLAAQPHTVSGLALDAKIRAWIVEPGLVQQTAMD
jgi:hypothetical protein